MKWAKAVVGASFGDEGKGRTVDFICRETNGSKIVVRFCGGQQAGHGVMIGGNTHVFSSFGSGTLRWVPTYISRYCTIDPISMMKELVVLENLGVGPKVNPGLYIDPKCPVTTPYDVDANVNDIERWTGRRHGSCGRGIGMTWQREEDHYSLLFEDLAFPSVLERKLELISRYYGAAAGARMKDEFLRSCHDVVHRFSPKGVEVLNEYDMVIFEGSQGLLLDQDYGFFPYVTRSSTGSRNVKGLIEEVSWGRDLVDPEYWVVTRAYQTRHGDGPMTNEGIEHRIRDNPYEINGSGGFQGDLRRTVLDVALLRYALAKDRTIRNSGNRVLVITCLDLVDKDGYRFTDNGEVVCCDEEMFVCSVSERLGFEHVYTSNGPTADDMARWSR